MLAFEGGEVKNQSENQSNKTKRQLFFFFKLPLAQNDLMPSMEEDIGC